MSRPGIGPLRIESDLVLTVGSTQVAIVADGPDITVSSDDTTELIVQAQRALAQLPGRPASARTLPGRAGALLADAGLRVQIVGREGTLLELGRDTTSRAGRLLLGGENVRLGGPRSLISTGSAYARSVPAARRGIAAAAAALAAVGLAITVSRSVRAAGRERDWAGPAPAADRAWAQDRA